MLGRTANDLFWMSRYIERAENIARLLEVGYRIALLPRTGDQEAEWYSTLRSAGCEEGFLTKHGSYATADVVVESRDLPHEAMVNEIIDKLAEFVRSQAAKDAAS